MNENCDRTMNLVGKNVNFENCNPKLRKIKPFHVRLKEYNIVRNRIFNEDKKTTRSSSRMREFWGKVRNFKRKCICSVLDRPSDVRPYAEVILFGKKLLGLLDTGASLSCIGSDVAKIFLESGQTFKKLNTSIKTADGTCQKIWRVSLRPILYLRE